MYQPAVPLIQVSPTFRTQRLAEVELGRLIQLHPTSGGAGAGLAVRADALSAQGDLSEGLVRLSGGPVRFERRRLDEQVTALLIDYVLETDLLTPALRSPEPGDLLVLSGRPAAGLYLGNVWPGTAALMDMASAVLRPFAAARSVLQLAYGWRLVDRDHRERVLLEHAAAEPEPEEAPETPLRRREEDCD